MKPSVIDAAIPPSLEQARAVLAITRQERDDAEQMAASAHHDKKLLEAERNVRRKATNHALQYEYECLQGAFNALATEAFGYAPVDTKEAIGSLELTQVGALMSEPEDDIAWLVEGAISPATLNATAGPPKVGKSSLLRQMAVAVATGSTWLERPCSKAVVLWIGVEDPRRATRRHFQAMQTDPDASLHIWTGPPPPPKTIPTHEWLARLIKLHQAKLVIVENFAKLAVVQDWNDYAAVTDALRPYDALAVSAGAAIMVGLHARKSGGEDGQAVMGSTQWVGSPSTIIEMSRDGENRFISSIQREGISLEKTLLRWDAETCTYHPGLTKRQVEAEKLNDDILGWLGGNAGANTSEVADAVGRKRQNVARTLNKMVDAGWLEVVGRGRSGDPFRYSLA